MHGDEYFMKEAIKEAKIAKKNGDWPVGCVIVIDNKIVSRGRNRVYSLNNKVLHAEIDAFLQAGDLLVDRGKDATMYITYDPCPMCLGAIILNHVGKIVCGSNIDGSGALGMTRFLPNRFSESKYKFKLIKKFMEKECKEIFISGDPVKKLNL